MPPEIFQDKILKWFDLYGRKDLPWQQNITPYSTWLSEVMLQQTQVVTVIPYFNQFILKFPDIHALATAPLDSILSLWSGLGYYARARNLHKTAQIISANNGEFPNNLDALIALPGIGRSTAGAILSIAFQHSHPILDGNVRRVLARHNAIVGWTSKSSVSKLLWELSSRYTPKERCAAYTQAIMDLGATVCTRSQPKCSTCPINSDCIALIENKVKELPTPKPHKKLVVKQLLFLILQDQNNQVFLTKKPTSGIWGGLWSFPEFKSISEIKDWCLEKQLPIHSLKQLNEQRHTFSHYHLDYTATIVKTEYLTNNVMEENQSVWYKSEQIHSLGLPTPIKKLLQSHF